MTDSKDSVYLDENLNHAKLGPEPRQKKPEETRCSIVDFSFKREIGKGSFGEVFLVEHRGTRKKYALKRMPREKETKKLQSSEYQLVVGIQCPFVVKLFDQWEDKDHVFLLMEYLPGGELFLLLNKMRKMTEEQAKFYIAQIILALEHLHSLNIIYRDLKPENTLLDSRGYLKMIDFGFAKQIEPDGRCLTLCGTPEYLAPEVFLGRGYTFAVDCWALGVLTWELVAGSPPWATEKRDKWRQIEVYESILAGLPPFPDHFSKSLKKVLIALLQNKPDRRLGAGVAKKEAWLEGIQWNQLWAKNVPPPMGPLLALLGQSEGEWTTF